MDDNELILALHDLLERVEKERRSSTEGFECQLSISRFRNPYEPAPDSAQPGIMPPSPRAPPSCSPAERSSSDNIESPLDVRSPAVRVIELDTRPTRTHAAHAASLDVLLAPCTKCVPASQTAGSVVLASQAVLLDWCDRKVPAGQAWHVPPPPPLSRRWCPAAHLPSATQ